MPIIPVDQKFHTLNASTPTKDRGSAQTDGLREIYTMQDIIDSVTTGGGIDFTELGDTPSTYAAATAGQVVTVNSGVDGLVFADAPSPVGIDLALNTRTNPYVSTGDHEGTVLSIGSLGLVVGTVYMWDSSEQWGTANAGAVGTASGLMGIATATDTAPDVLVSGIIQVAAAPGAAGDVLYVDIINGTLTNAAPNGSGEIVRVMGHNLGGNRIYFNPSSDWIEIV